MTEQEIDDFNSNRLPYEQIGEQGYYHGYEMGYQEASRGDIPQLTKRPQKRPFLSYVFPFFYSREVRNNTLFWSADFWSGYCAGWKEVRESREKGRITNLQVKDGEIVTVENFSD